jgi:hypothetical protein
LQQGTVSIPVRRKLFNLVTGSFIFLFFYPLLSMFSLLDISLFF